MNIQRLHLKNMPMDWLNLGRYDKSKMIFPFLLAQADQGDLKQVKNADRHMRKCKIQ